MLKSERESTFRDVIHRRSNGKGEINNCMASRWYIYTVMDSAHIDLKLSRLHCGVSDV